MMLRSLVVAGDSGEDYTISIDPVRGTATCSCPAFSFRRDLRLCKHLAYVAGLFARDDV